MTTELVSLSPASNLSFDLDYGTQPETLLKVTNTSQHRIICKIKTTQPKWYAVRPNQRMLDVGESEDIVIALIEKACRSYLDSVGSEEEMTLDKHRFLVQCKIVDDDDYVRISSMIDGPAKTEECNNLWNVAEKDDKVKKKLKVSFNLPEKLKQGGGNAEDVKKKIAREEIDPANMSPETIFQELQDLKKKYDALVDYTVHLTTERDEIGALLQTMQKEQREEKPVKVVNKGFSLLVLVFAAILAFLCGKFIA